LVRCPYCDFNAYAGIDDLIDPYVEALIREIEAATDAKEVATIFFGGGTPTQLAPSKLGTILAVIRDCFNVDGQAEITIEANPETVDERVFVDLLSFGFNRVSVGVQSLSAKVLRSLGRAHDANRALSALTSARAAGFQRVNADLIFGIPGETVADWRQSIERVVATGVDHISAYALTIEEGTPLASWVDQGKRTPVDEDDQATKYEIAHDMLVPSGFVRYEISNWSFPGSWSAHNVNYWQQGDYLGFGAGAHGHREGRRSWNVKLPREYIARSPEVEDGFELLDAEQSVEECAFLGLRLAAGIDRSSFAAKFGTDPVARWPGLFEKFKAEGLVLIDPRSIRLTDRGLLMAGYVAQGLMGSNLLQSSVNG
jgi:oxygen-independent coproporphyrinogen-3 oxidase